MKHKRPLTLKSWREGGEVIEYSNRTGRGEDIPAAASPVYTRMEYDMRARALGDWNALAESIR